MCPNLTQPEEIDLALKETEGFDLQIDRHARNAETIAKAAQNCNSATNCSAYRAEYMKTHNLDP